MQTSYNGNEGKKTVYKRGSFAFLCGTAVVGVLLGAMCFCLKTANADRLMLFGSSLQDRAEMDYGKIMAGSLLGSTAFLLALALAGFCALGQPFELALLMFRGMGIGCMLTEVYADVGKNSVPYAAGLLLPGAVISLLALVAAAREALCLSNIYLRVTLSSRGGEGLAETAKLYGAKMLVIEAMLALAAGADTVCNYLFIGRIV
ncbi:hypothetical protein [uncultured Ruminococcus sp.]|uniref:hypothetical protein n=1 Tax=uncultured Ruminococcus sp. TaxID=165186 RepID=UPI000ED74F81|nr:hypothetical protein [uncultured Ruminococcus sp.]HCJ40714.1 hypothetical protein [Ruminococcus sp.]